MVYTKSSADDQLVTDSEQKKSLPSMKPVIALLTPSPAAIFQMSAAPKLKPYVHKAIRFSWD